MNSENNKKKAYWISWMLNKGKLRDALNTRMKNYFLFVIVVI